MSFGFEIRRADGSLNISSSSVPGAVKTSFFVGAGSSGSVSYSDLAGFTVSVTLVPESLLFTAQITTAPAAWVTYSGSTPIVNWGGSSNVGATIYVFAK